MIRWYRTARSIRHAVHCAVLEWLVDRCGDVIRAGERGV